jgi:transposase
LAKGNLFDYLKDKRMKKWNVILGVDISKLTLDISCAELGLHIKIDNCSKGFAEFNKWCKTHGIDLNETLVVMEYTGGYEYRFIQYCDSKSIAFCRVPGMEIKQSMGMVRGKNDKADAFRIGRYGEEKRDRLTPSKLVDHNILTLKQLLSFRKRLVREKAGLQSTSKEREHMYAAKKTDTIMHIAQVKIKADDKYISLVEQQIRELIKTNEELFQNYRIITSIKGIGEVNGWMTIAYTENFKSFTNARAYGVYVGVVPFGHSSGTSIKGRKRVSHLANKELKSELSQAAKCAIAHDTELHAYAERKLKNKDYGVVINNVKFKLILRMFSLVKRGELYVENYKKSA